MTHSHATHVRLFTTTPYGATGRGRPSQFYKTLSNYNKSKQTRETYPSNLDEAVKKSIQVIFSSNRIYLTKGVSR